ncbi:mismatched base pair and cruciform DNA recognition protein [Lentinula aciculospora]|uniref:Mismatched base pair and cruciform DNA recognition protein n=1 Tax=Lentinula aciculospora TaxID=153920 RepID=A0A9W9DXA0_9AGAR|nr:mismatched base pair and cruciform DNA recognition protein [Lentinula aciculospora]
MSYNNKENSSPNKTTGQFHSLKGNAVETVGNEYNNALTQGYAEGTVDRAGGYKDSVLSAIKDDKSQQTARNWRHDQGQTQQEFNRRAWI